MGEVRNGRRAFRPRAVAVVIAVGAAVAGLAAVSAAYLAANGTAYAVQARQRRPPRPGAVALTAAPPQTVPLALPFEGIWGVVQGFDTAETHVGYAAYAVDFVPAENLARALPEVKRRRLADFPCFGQAVLASADGVVVWARDASPDPPPRARRPPEPGNFVIVEHAPGEYTELRHLQAGSVRVKVGQRVTRGQPLARCGNSGNALTPHLHIGLLGSVEPIATRPMRFSGYQVLQADGSWRPGDGVPLAGQLVRSTPPR